MDPTELARKMLKWEEAQRHADELAEQIKETVLAIGKTQTVGNVRASFRNGTKRYDYEKAWQSHYGDELPSVEFEKTTFDWRGACQSVGLEEIPFTQSGPSVSIKLL